MIIKSNRLYLRKLKMDDLDHLHKLQSNSNVMRYITNRPKTIEETKNELIKILQMYMEKNTDFEVMAFCKNETSQLVGTCAVIKNEADEFEIGYRLAEEEWGNGYGSEIASLIEDYCFGIRKLNFIVATVEAKNIYSVKILEKKGFNLILEANDDENGELTKYYRKDRHNY
ncbi:GNAT family N-acetyltransferase [Gottfriedia acidiceleris]|uniref:GNAT family N-acetyltransferase n=1 Tax=Gottfriedia acidiceleris TaxID=371036 RepID=UPI00101D6CA1|nr:GNAT family N-acetyltransferase [Gottfriedia acidiceleris]